MAITDSFRRQHAEIAELIQSIEGKLSPVQIPENAEEIQKLLSDLAGKISVHLSLEDKSLYPMILERGNDEAKKVATEYMDEMGGIASAFGDYTTKWSSSFAIKDNPSDFCADTNGLFEALKQRVGREESVLYPLADAL